MSNKFYANAGHFYAPHVMPVLLDCNFVVDSSNGLGITSLKGPGVANVFMHTSTTPAVGNRGQTNPNPASGIIIVQLGDPYYFMYGIGHSIAAPLTGSALTSVTAGLTYVITALGTATTAQWVALGFPLGVTPVVGAAFTATATAAIPGSATAKVSGVSGVSGIEIIGNAQQTLAPVGIGTIGGPGAQIQLQVVGPTSAGVTTFIPKAPADGSTIFLSFYLSNSSAGGGLAG